MIIYMITNKINGKRYIGQTIRSLQERWNNHCSNRSFCRRLKHSIQKYGKDNFTIKVISRCVSLEEMNHRESYYIMLFNTLSPNGYNLKTGGNNSKPLEETKLKMSRSQKGSKKPPRTEEQRKNMSLAKKGIRQSPQTIEKRSRGMFRAIEVPELKMTFESSKAVREILGTHQHVITNILNGTKTNWKGLTFHHIAKDQLKEHSLESKKLLDLFLQHKKHGWIGKKRSLEEIEKNRIRNQKVIFCFEINKTFDSIKSAAKELKLQESGIGMVIRGKHKQTGGYTFKYLNEVKT